MPISGDTEMPGTVSGFGKLKAAKHNMGLAFTINERQVLGIHGLMPARVKTVAEQIQQCIAVLDLCHTDLDRYVYLMGLLTRNERLFYKLFAYDISRLMPLVYTPTVGAGCLHYSLLYTNPFGLFISIDDKGHIYDVIKSWPEIDVRAVVVTDGARILGLGDLGVNGMGIPIGKLVLYTALAGIKPTHCLPITLDVGTSNQSLLADSLYIGLRHKRLIGKEYDDFIEEFMQAIVRRFGRACLIQFEDFGNDNAFRLLAQYRDSYCTFNDDIQGSAAVALAGIYTAQRITKKPLKSHVILFQGAGEASLGIANLCVRQMISEGVNYDVARKKVWLFDSKGLVIKNRPKGGLTVHKEIYAHEYDPVETLEEAVSLLKPSMLIGAAAIGGVFTRNILNLMAQANDRPVIFALSNPTIKAECTASEAYLYTNGTCLYSSGSPFRPVEFGGKTYYPSQGNNSYVFPGLALGIISCGILTVTEDFFLLAASTLSNLVTQKHMEEGRLYPPIESIKECVFEIAVKTVEYAYRHGHATLVPEPEDKRAFVASQLYDTDYRSALPPTW